MRRELLLGALPVLALFGSGCDDTLLDPMMDDQKYKPYEANEFFADDRSMRTPPEGTVPRERVMGDAPLTTGRSDWAEGSPYVDYVPVPVTRKMILQ